MLRSNQLLLRNNFSLQNFPFTSEKLKDESAVAIQLLKAKLHIHSKQA